MTITTNTNSMSQSSSDDEEDDELHDDPLRETQAFIRLARNELYARLLPTLRRLFLREGISHFPAIQDESLAASANTDALACKSDIFQIISATKDTLTELLRSSQPEALISELTLSLAILSRQRYWMKCFAEQSLLDCYLDALPTRQNDAPKWTGSALRLIANCCARSLQTRATVFEKAPFDLLIDRVLQKEDADISLLAMQSICSGHRPAEMELQAKHNLTLKLLQFMREERLDQNSADDAIFFCGLAPEAVDVALVSPDHIQGLLKVSSVYRISAESFANLTELLLVLLKHERVKRIVMDGQFSSLMAFFLQSFPDKDGNPLELSPKGIFLSDPVESDGEMLKDTRKSLIEAFGELALMPNEAKNVEADISTIVTWLAASEPQVLICACLFLGTSIYSHNHITHELMRHHKLGSLLAECIKNARDQEVLSSAFDLLHNLAVDRNVREQLGQQRLLHALAHCWSLQTAGSQASGKALYHTRQLLRECLPNIHVFLRKEAEVYPIANGMMIDELLLASTGTRDPTSSIEISRIIAEIWRSAYKGQQEGAKDDGQLELAKTVREELQRVLRRRGIDVLELVYHLALSDNESLTSEAWLVMALISSTDEGAQLVYSKLCGEDEATSSLLRETMKKPDVRSGSWNNARFLTSQLEKHFVHDVKRSARLHQLTSTEPKLAKEMSIEKTV